MTRVGLSGCGAVTQLYYGPALRRLQSEGLVTLAGVFDPDLEAARAAAASIGGEACRGLEDLLALGLDLLIVAAPPRFHAQQARQALGAGVAVHCEKPLALSADEGENMARAAAAADRPLTVGLMRRSFPAVRAIASMLAQETIGRLRSVDVFEGGPFDWPVRSPAYFSTTESGGGVLRDLGPHALDLLAGWFGALDLTRYEDDAEGGVEANCRVDLVCAATPCTVRMSRDWARPNRYLFTGERGWFSWVPYEPDRLRISLGDDAGGVFVLHRPQLNRPHELGEPEGDFLTAFTDHLRGVVDGLATRPPPTPRSLAIDTLELIDRCYAMRRPMAQPWRVA